MYIYTHTHTTHKVTIYGQCKHMRYVRLSATQLIEYRSLSDTLHTCENIHTMKHIQYIGLCDAQLIEYRSLSDSLHT